MRRQCAFIPTHPMQEGALHCHTTRSDGKLTPEETFKAYEKAGFDFIALTDHRIYNHRNFAPETGITLIPGVEVDKNLTVEGVHCFHTVWLGPAEEDGNGFSHDEEFPREVISGQEEFQAYLDDAHAKNNITIYAHPEWSMTTAREFEKLRGNVAMEVWNTGCVLDYGCDYDAPCWDELLRQGIRIFGVATDDGHAIEHVAKGWVMVNAENDVKDILRALKEGAFYSSCGPVIHDFYVEDGVAHVECSPCSAVRFVMDKVSSRRTYGENLTNWKWALPEFCTYVRACVTDAQGRQAWTNPIWLDD